MGTGFRLGAEGRRGGANTVPWKTMLALDLSGPVGTKSAEKCLQKDHRKIKQSISLTHTHSLNFCLSDACALSLSLTHTRAHTIPPHTPHSHCFLLDGTSFCPIRRLSGKRWFGGGRVEYGLRVVRSPWTLGALSIGETLRKHMGNL